MDGANKKRELLVKKWAEFFNLTGIPYQYRGLTYGKNSSDTPDFIVPYIYGRSKGPCFFIVGEREDKSAIDFGMWRSGIRIIGLTDMPACDFAADDATKIQYLSDFFKEIGDYTDYYNFESFDGDRFVCHIRADRKQNLYLIGDDSSYFGCGEDELYTWDVFAAIHQLEPLLETKPLPKEGVCINYRY